MTGRILLLVDGPAAAVPGLELLLHLRQAGFSVRVAATASALTFQSVFSWAAFSGHPCLEFEALQDDTLKNAELIIACPVSAGLLDLLCSDMWRQRLASAGHPLLAVPALLPSDQADDLAERWVPQLPLGSRVLLPEGHLCDLGAMGKIALTALDRCFEEVCNYFTAQDLAGKHLLLTAGPTIEDIDPVRFISNRSTGRMGLALAKVAARRGALVSLIHGPLADPIPANPRIAAFPVRSAQAMHDLTMEKLSGADIDIAVLCAAVADFTPNIYAPEKIKKQGTQELTLFLRRTPDILAGVGQLPKRPFLVGFAAESNDLELNARHKLNSKHCDIICANDIREPGCGFAVATNRITMYFDDGTHLQLPLLSKDETAERIFDQVAARLSNPKPA
jgi:phosphopantothenoylcysteine decarboxylase/phosphopantothenate--cysteine ligase